MKKSVAVLTPYIEAESIRQRAEPSLRQTARTAAAPRRSRSGPLRLAAQRITWASAQPTPEARKRPKMPLHESAGLIG